MQWSPATSHQPSSLAILVEWLHNLICVPGLSGVMSTKLENKIKHVYVKIKYDGIFIEVSAWSESLKFTSSSFLLVKLDNEILKMKMCLSRRQR